MARPTQAIVDLEALRHNGRLARSLGGDGQLMAVVKANAYGHGAIPAAKALEPLVSAFAVACIEEAEELRNAGLTRPIMLMEGFFEPTELEIAARRDFWVMLQNRWQLEALEAAPLPKPLTCWLKLDSGMHRLGFALDESADLLKRLRALNNVADEVVLATHLACADELDNDFTPQQIKAFRQHTDALGAPCSMANSPGILGWPDARGAWNRAGVMLYGQSPFPGPHPEADKLKPVMTLQSQVIAVREVAAGETVGYGGAWTARRNSQIATVPVGYGDGYPRNAGNGTPVLINHRRAPLVGRVSMDMITVDVTDLPPVAVGEPVELWGNGITANEVAAHANSIGYEVMTRMLPRVPRIYSGQ
jgi:alanine racemase